MLCFSKSSWLAGTDLAWLPYSDAIKKVFRIRRFLFQISDKLMVSFKLSAIVAKSARVVLPDFFKTGPGDIFLSPEHRSSERQFNNKWAC